VMMISACALVAVAASTTEMSHTITERIGLIPFRRLRRRQSSLWLPPVPAALRAPQTFLEGQQYNS
jgi:hypothetical protein